MAVRKYNPQVARGTPNSYAEPDQYTSLVASPQTAAPAKACSLFLATAPSYYNRVPEPPRGSLGLVKESDFVVRVTDLRVPPWEDEALEYAEEMLWHAIRETKALRRGAILLAEPANEEDEATLRSYGFDDATAGDNIDPSSGLPTQPLLALIQRRDPKEPTGFNHATLRVSAIERSIDFWSLLHFAPTRTFTASGARCAWLSSPWCDLSIELIEVPELVLRQMPKSLLTPNSDALGPAHLCLDVTPLGVTLTDTLELLQQRSKERFDGRTLKVLQEPHQQMMGDLVSEVVIVRAPDGVELRLTAQSAILEQPMEPDWKNAAAAAEDGK